MDVRYEGDRASEPQLRLTDAAATINSASANMGKLSTLLRWHEGDPVDAVERRRNDLIYERYQHNRNPFVDHPEWVNLVFRPRLAIAQKGDRVEVSWDSGWSNATVEASSNLRVWSTIATNSVPASDAFRFFRLRVPVD